MVFGNVKDAVQGVLTHFSVVKVVTTWDIVRIEIMKSNLRKKTTSDVLSVLKNSWIKKLLKKVEAVLEMKMNFQKIVIGNFVKNAKSSNIATVKNIKKILRFWFSNSEYQKRKIISNAVNVKVENILMKDIGLVWTHLRLKRKNTNVQIAMVKENKKSKGNLMSLKEREETKDFLLPMSKEWMLKTLNSSKISLKRRKEKKKKNY